jgi:hypothetical protein
MRFLCSTKFVLPGAVRHFSLQFQNRFVSARDVITVATGRSTVTTLLQRYCLLQSLRCGGPWKFCTRLYLTLMNSVWNVIWFHETLYKQNVLKCNLLYETLYEHHLLKVQRTPSLKMWNVCSEASKHIRPDHTKRDDSLFWDLKFLRLLRFGVAQSVQ